MDLSKTEFRVSAHITAGYDVKEIASKFHRSYHTVASQIKTIRLKNKLKNLAEISREFVLEFGDPRHYIAMVFLIIQVGLFFNIEDDEYKRTRKTKIARTKIASKKHNG
ncbi:MAG: LuxR C-terminal-related transcriptional regulator [Polaribacter sp.]|uniref:helix-turn-helix transcriptional regulator n=1 Tax=Polaribacter sp. TaxID=1920175 RepID=UPI002F3582C5